MTSRLRWTRRELLVAFALYCRLPFGRLHKGNPEIIKFADAIGRSPSSLAMKLSNIASLDQTITDSGRVGLRSASATDREMWQEMEADSANFAVECQTALMEAENQVIPQDEPVEESIERLGEDRLTQTKVRVGQSFFREAVLSAYDWQCCITGLSVSSLLIASHIVPWRHDKMNRLNPRNGLALSVLHDRAFDAGLITINEDMTVRVSQNHTAMEDAFFRTSIESYDGQLIRLPQKFGIGEEFLAYHRKYIFQE